MSHSATSAQFWNTPMDGDLTTSLGKLSSAEEIFSQISDRQLELNICKTNSLFATVLTRRNKSQKLKPKVFTF